MSYISVRWIVADSSGSSVCGKTGRILSTDIETVNGATVVQGAAEVNPGDVLTVRGEGDIAVVLSETAWQWEG